MPSDQNPPNQNTPNPSLAQITSELNLVQLAEVQIKIASIEATNAKLDVSSAEHKANEEIIKQQKEILEKKKTEIGLNNSLLSELEKTSAIFTSLEKNLKDFQSGLEKVGTGVTEVAKATVALAHAQAKNFKTEKEQKAYVHGALKGKGDVESVLSATGIGWLDLGAAKRKYDTFGNQITWAKERLAIGNIKGEKTAGSKLLGGVLSTLGVVTKFLPLLTTIVGVITAIYTVFKYLQAKTLLGYQLAGETMRAGGEGGKLFWSKVASEYGKNQGRNGFLGAKDFETYKTNLASVAKSISTSSDASFFEISDTVMTAANELGMSVENTAKLARVYSFEQGRSYGSLSKTLKEARTEANKSSLNAEQYNTFLMAATSELKFFGYSLSDVGKAAKGWANDLKKGMSDKTIMNLFSGRLTTGVGASMFFTRNSSLAPNETRISKAMGWEYRMMASLKDASSVTGVLNTMRKDPALAGLMRQYRGNLTGGAGSYAEIEALRSTGLFSESSLQFLKEKLLGEDYGKATADNTGSIKTSTDAIETAVGDIKTLLASVIDPTKIKDYPKQLTNFSAQVASRFYESLGLTPT